MYVIFTKHQFLNYPYLEKAICKRENTDMKVVANTSGFVIITGLASTYFYTWPLKNKK